jgi:aspartyl-tRNA(Asn)/glutamyl-tRNA(Gln) amidotransferase subunit B
MAEIVKSRLVIGMEVHVELATRTKMFSRSPSPASDTADHPPNTLIDPVVLALPGALPVLNARAVHLSILVGLALRCSIADVTRWDRKSYFYPDLPKNYQLSQLDLPLCYDGAFDLPPILDPQPKGGGPVAIDWPLWEKGLGGRRIGIIRAHLEEDAGKLHHEAPAGTHPGTPIKGSIADYNRAGTPLLEIVTQPDFESADQAVLFCQSLHTLCTFLGATRGVLERGHMRFEPNINCHLTLSDGRLVKTPIVEVKNLNSFKAVRGAIEHEAADQPARWLATRREMGPGAKETRGWDDARMVTLPQREKEDAHDYRYFPDPDLLPLTIPRARVQEIARELPELPLARLRRYAKDFALSPKDAAPLAEDRADSTLFEAAVLAAQQAGIPAPRAGKGVANLLLQYGLKRANQSQTPPREGPLTALGLTPDQLGRLAALRDQNTINSNAAAELFDALCDAKDSPQPPDPEALARSRGFIIIHDDAALDRWCDDAIANNPAPAADVRAGKEQAIGRLVGAAMKLAAGKADAARLRARLIEKLRP